MTQWLEDSDGNKASVEYFGSVEKAQNALDSLINCANCINCSNCANCTNCTNCVGCINCEGLTSESDRRELKK